MKTNSYLLILLMLLLFSNISKGQKKWQYILNVDLPSHTAYERFDDIYFTDYLTGTAVDLKGNVFKTKNGGDSWYRTIPKSSTQYRSIEFLEDGKTGIIGSLHRGEPSGAAVTMRTEDGGESWANISLAISDTNSLYYKKSICGLSHFNTNFYGVGWYASDIAHFYKSTDKGLTWHTTYIDSNLATGLVDVIFISEDTGFVSGTRKSTTCVVLKTTDGGNTWKTVFSDETIGGLIWKLQKVDKDNFVGSIQPLDKSTISTIKSSDGGNNWTIINSGLKSAPTTQGIGFITPLHGWLGGWYSGIYETKDGGKTWDSLYLGMNFNRFFIFDGSHAYAAGQTVYRLGNAYSLGIQNQNLQSKVPHNLYPISPNPSNGKVKIEFDLGTNTIAVVQVINIATKQVWEIHRDILNPGHYSFDWNGNNAPSGTYIVRLENNEIGLSQKFILAK